MKWTHYVLVAVTIVLAAMLFKQCGKTKQAEALQSATADTLETFRNDNGEMVAEIQSYEIQHANDLLKIKAGDEATRKLQQEIEDYKGQLYAALTATTSTTSQGTTETTVTESDTVPGEEGFKYIYPTYSTTWSNRWEEGEITARLDSISRLIKTKNEYVFTIGQRRNGWFKQRETEVNMRNLNPNTVTEELRSFNVKEKPKRLNLVVYVGYGMNPNGLGLQFGGGLGYTVLSIK